MNPFDYSKGYLEALNSLKIKINELIESHEYELGVIADEMSKEAEND